MNNSPEQSDTPLTDAVIRDTKFGNGETNVTELAKHARQLERQRKEMAGKVEEMHTELLQARMDLVMLRSEQKPE